MKDKPFLEIAISPTAGYSDTGKLTQQARDAFDSLGSLLSDAIEPLRKKLAEAAASAAEIEVNLALALAGGGNWVVVSMEGSATVSIKLVWRKAPGV